MSRPWFARSLLLLALAVAAACAAACAVADDADDARDDVARDDATRDAAAAPPPRDAPLPPPSWCAGVAPAPDDPDTDPDDARVFPGDRLHRRATPGDADVFRLDARPGHYDLELRPAAPGLDLAVDIHDDTGQWIAAFDDGGPGATERTPVHAPAPLTLIVVVRGRAGSGAYDLELR